MSCVKAKRKGEGNIKAPVLKTPFFSIHFFWYIIRRVWVNWVWCLYWVVLWKYFQIFFSLIWEHFTAQNCVTFHESFHAILVRKLLFFSYCFVRTEKNRKLRDWNIRRVIYHINLHVTKRSWRWWWNSIRIRNHMENKSTCLWANFFEIFYGMSHLIFPPPPGRRRRRQKRLSSH